MSNKFVSILETVGKDIEKDLSILSTVPRAAPEKDAENAHPCVKPLDLNRGI